MAQVAGQGCAVDELTIALCKQLGIVLSNSQVYVLQHGEASLSDADRLAMSREEAQATKAKLECERALAQERAKASADRAKRLQEESEQKAADAQRDAERSLENKKRRDELSAQVAQKAAKARTLKADGLNALEQIAMIESKKRTLCEMRDTLQRSIEEAKQAGDEEFDEKKKSISSEAYRKGEQGIWTR